MKKTYLLFLALFFVQAVHAQSKLDDLPIGVLKQKLQQSLPDTGRVIIQLALGRSLLFKSGSGPKEIDSSTNLANDAAKLSNEFDYHQGITNSLLLRALIYNKKGQRDKGLATAQQALAYSKSVKNLAGIAESYIIIGQHYATNDSSIYSRIRYYNMALSIFQQGNYRFRQATTMKDIADLYNLVGKRSESLKLLFQALNMYKSIGYKRVQGIYWLIGLSSSASGDLTNGLKYDLLAIEAANEVNDTTLQLCSIYYSTARAFYYLENYKTAIAYLKKAEQIARHFHNDDYLATVDYSLVSYYIATHQTAPGIRLLKKIAQMATFQDLYGKIQIESEYLPLLERLNQHQQAAVHARTLEKLLSPLKADDVDAMTAWELLLFYYFDTKQYDKCYIYIKRFNQTIKKDKGLPALRFIEGFTFRLDTATGNYKSAIKHRLNEQVYQDSMVNMAKNYQISFLQIENETEKKEKDIQLLTRQTQLKDNLLKRKQIIQNVILIVSLLLIIITVLVYSRYRIKRRSNLLLQAQKNEIDQQNNALQFLLLDKNHLIGEKDLLLKEVNHRVKNNLQMIMSLLESQSAYLDNEVAQGAIIESQNRVQALALIHQKLYHVNNVTDVNMEEYISELVTYLNNSYNTNEKAILIYHSVDDINLDVSQAIPVGLILNEAITNAIKHAFKGRKNGEIFISLSHTDQQHLKLTVTDNGVGLPIATETKNSGSLGMILIKGLTRQLNGDLLIEEKNGFSITIEFSTQILIETKKPGPQVQLTV